MKTKKLHLLFALLVAFTFNSVTAQRGTCDTQATNMFIYDGTSWIDDWDNASLANPNPIVVEAGAEVKVGSNPYIDNAGQVEFWTIDISNDMGTTPIQINAGNVGSHGTAWEPTVPAEFFVAGAEVTVSMVVDPTDTWAAPCATAWTYVWTINVTADCLDPTLTLYHQINSSGGWNDGVTDISIGTGDVINFGLSDISGGVWSWTTDSGTATISNTATRNPDVSGFEAGTNTVTATFTRDCGASVSQVFNITISSGCTAIPSFAYYNVDGSWVNVPTGTTTIDIFDVPSTAIYIGVDPKVDMAWSGGCGQIALTGQEQNFIPVFDGSGNCTITATRVNNCGDTDIYTFNLSENPSLSIGKFEQAGFSMYPNPAKDNLNINFNGDLDVVILNTAGQKVITRSMNGQATIDVSSLSTGIYFVKLAADKDVITRKFIKN